MRTAPMACQWMTHAMRKIFLPLGAFACRSQCVGSRDYAQFFCWHPAEGEDAIFHKRSIAPASSAIMADDQKYSRQNKNYVACREAGLPPQRIRIRWFLHAALIFFTEGKAQCNHQPQMGQPTKCKVLANAGRWRFAHVYSRLTIPTHPSYPRTCFLVGRQCAETRVH